MHKSGSLNLQNLNNMHIEDLQNFVRENIVNPKKEINQTIIANNMQITNLYNSIVTIDGNIDVFTRKELITIVKFSIIATKWNLLHNLYIDHQSIIVSLISVTNSLRLYSIHFSTSQSSKSHRTLWKPVSEWLKMYITENNRIQHSSCYNTKKKKEYENVIIDIYRFFPLLTQKVDVL